MSEAMLPRPLIKGWCPGALRPMASGDGLVVRLRPRDGRLMPDQALGVARLALAHGNGQIDLTSRANLQVRGVKPASYGALLEGLAGLGLVDASPEEEARRNILVTPFWSAGDGTLDLAAALADAVTGQGVPVLPDKFGFAVDPGAVSVLGGASADIRIERDAAGGLICRADGAATGAPVTATTAIDRALQLARWFVETGGMVRGRGRMARHLAAGAALPDVFRRAPVRQGAFALISPGVVDCGFAVGFAFGQISGETLAQLAGHGALRLTPWRMLVVEDVDWPGDIPDIPGLITRADDPLLGVAACSGAPRCPQAHQPTRVIARHLAHVLAPHLPQRLSAPDGVVLHVSGCAKGCAHAGRAAITLTAGPEGYDIVRGGRAGDEPEIRALATAELAPSLQTQLAASRADPSATEAS